jgi:hypothetical protein
MAQWRQMTMGNGRKKAQEAQKKEENILFLTPF